MKLCLDFGIQNSVLIDKKKAIQIIQIRNENILMHF